MVRSSPTAKSKSVVRHLKEQGTPAYIEDVTREEEEPEGSEGLGGEEGSGDDLYDKAVQLVSPRAQGLDELRPAASANRL